MMHNLLVGLLTVGLLQVPGAWAQEDEARAIVAKAVQAHGGAKLLKAKGLQLKAKTAVEANGMKFTGTLEKWVQFPDRLKLASQTEVNTLTISMTMVFAGKQGWIKTQQDEAKEIDANVLKEMPETFHLERVTNLLFLKDPAYKLSPVGEVRVEDRPALGVRVEAEGFRGINLYFDKATGLLVKTEARGKNAAGQEVALEHYFKDYKDVDGTKAPARIVVHHDGNPVMEMEITEYQWREEGFGDEVFAKP